MGTNQELNVSELVAKARTTILPWPQELCVEVVAALEALNSDHTESEKALIDTVNDLADERDKLRSAIENARAGYEWARDGGEALEAVMKALKGAGDVQG